MFVTLQETKDHLKIDFSDTNVEADLNLKITAASSFVAQYVQNVPSSWVGPDVPFQVKAATLLIVQSLFDDSQEAKMLKGLALSDLSNPVVALLYPLRTLSMA